MSLHFGFLGTSYVYLKAGLRRIYLDCSNVNKCSGLGKPIATPILPYYLASVA